MLSHALERACVLELCVLCRFRFSLCLSTLLSVLSVPYARRLQSVSYLRGAREKRVLMQFQIQEFSNK